MTTIFSLFARSLDFVWRQPPAPRGVATRVRRRGLRAAIPLLAAAMLGPGVSGAISTVATGVYDESAIQPNAVDVNVAGAAAMQGALNGAFPAGRGGVAAFDDVAEGAISGEIAVTFAGGTKVLRVADGGTSDGFAIGDVAGASRTPISGTRLLQASDALHADGEKNDWVFRFRPVAVGGVEERVTRAGITILGRDGSNRVIEKVTALFSDGSSATIHNVNYTGRGTADTFVGFEAPPGRYIEEMRLENTGSDYTSLDDLAFVTGTFGPPLPAIVPYTGRYFDVVKAYAEAMMAHGRDTYGSGLLPGGGDRKSGLFLSALDRTSGTAPSLLSGTLPAAPFGVREIDRAIHLHRDNPARRLYGSDLGDNQQFLAMLRELSDETGDAGYAEAADQNIEWMFRHGRSGINGDAEVPTGFLAWGEHTNWDVVNDRAATGFYTGDLVHEFTERFDLWDRVFLLAPADGADYAVGIWNWQIHDKATGGYDRHAFYDGAKGFTVEFDFPRHGGYYIHAWAAALRSQPSPATVTLLRGAVETLLGRFESKKAAALAAYGPGHDLIQMADHPRDADLWSVYQTLELTLAAHLAAEMMDAAGGDPLAARLRGFARGEDRTFLAQPHAPRTTGFVTSRTISSLAIQGRSAGWGMAYGDEGFTHLFGVRAAARARQLAGSVHPEDIAHRGQYEALAIEAAEYHVASTPDSDGDGSLDDEHVWAVEVAYALDLLLDAFEFTGDERFLRRARFFGDLAVDGFWAGRSLPRASTDVQHYEAVTGAGDLGRAVLRLHRALMAHLLPDRTARIAPGGGDFLKVSTRAVPGARYRLWESGALAAWEVAAERDAASDRVEFQVARPTGARKFFRISAVPNLPE